MSMTEKFRNKLFKKKIFIQDYYSYDSRTTNQNSEENITKKKNKIVSFNSVEIIDVECYKEFNKLDSSIEVEAFEKENSKKCEKCNCLYF